MKVIRILALGAVAAALSLGAAATAHAQADQPQAGARGGNRMMAMLFNGITLTDAQKAQIDSIQAKYRAQMPPMTPGTPPDSATRAQRRAIMQQETADIRAVLTPDQQQQFDKNLDEMRSRMMRRSGPR